MWKRLLKSLQGENEEIPDFEQSEKKRYHVLFYGHVQGVGFRIEVYQMALKLELTGWVSNRSDGSVEAVLQGEKDRIDYLIEHMRKLSRAQVSEIIQREVDLLKNEQNFSIK